MKRHFNTSDFAYTSKDKTLKADRSKLTAGEESAAMPMLIEVTSASTGRIVKFRFDESINGKTGIYKPVENLPGVEKIVIDYTK